MPISSHPEDYFLDTFKGMDNSNTLYCHNEHASSQTIKGGTVSSVLSSMEHLDRRNETKQNGNSAFNFKITKCEKGKGTAVNGEIAWNDIISDERYEAKNSLFTNEVLENYPIIHKYSHDGSTVKEHPTANGVNEEQPRSGSIENGKLAQTASHSNSKPAQNELITNDKQLRNGFNGMYMHIDIAEEQPGSYSSIKVRPNDDKVCTDQIFKSSECSYSSTHEKVGFDDPIIFSENLSNSSSFMNLKIPHTSVVVTSKLTAAALKDLFEDQICVLHIPNYVPQVVCDKLDRFFKDRGSEQYTHEIRKDGRADLLYFGVNRFGFPLNSTYNDITGKSMERYFSEALPTMQSIRSAAAPYLSPIDKLRVEMDETWPKKVNVATLNGQKTFCGIGRVMPASLSELSADQPHFDAVPTTYFPDIHKQFAANIYLNVPEEGGELEIWDVPPVDVENVENFTIPENWRSQLPSSIKVKPGAGDLLLLNTRRPHAITKFSGDKPRTSIQSFIGLTKESEVFLWV